MLLFGFAASSISSPPVTLTTVIPQLSQGPISWGKVFHKRKSSNYKIYHNAKLIQKYKFFVVLNFLCFIIHLNI